MNFAKLRKDERGIAMMQMAALVIAPIVGLAIITAAVTVVRTGTDVTEALQRGSLAQSMLNGFKSSLSTATTIDVHSPTSFSVTTDPGKIPPAISVATDTIDDFCVTSTWEFVQEADLAALVHTRNSHESADCASPVAQTTDTKLTGLQISSKFEYQNLYGRELAVSTGGVITPAAGAAPAGVSADEWNSQTIGTLRISATMQELFGDRELRATATTWGPRANAGVSGQVSSGAKMQELSTFAVPAGKLTTNLSDTSAVMWKRGDMRAYTTEGGLLTFKDPNGMTPSYGSFSGTHFVGLLYDGSFATSGTNTYGQLATGTTTSREVTVPTKTNSVKYVKVAAETNLTFALDDTGILWGAGWKHPSLKSTAPFLTGAVSSLVQLSTKTFKDFDASTNRVGGIDTAGNVWTWGFSTGTTVLAETQIALPGKAVFISIDDTGGAAVLEDGRAYAWDIADTAAPLTAKQISTTVAGTNVKVTQAHSTKGHEAFLTTDGRIFERLKVLRPASETAAGSWSARTTLDWAELSFTNPTMGTQNPAAHASAFQLTPNGWAVMFNGTVSTASGTDVETAAFSGTFTGSQIRRNTATVTSTQADRLIVRTAAQDSKAFVIGKATPGQKASFVVASANPRLSVGIACVGGTAVSGGVLRVSQTNPVITEVPLVAAGDGTLRASVTFPADNSCVNTKPEDISYVLIGPKNELTAGVDVYLTRG